MAKNLQITESYSTEIQFLRGISSIIQDANPVIPPIPIDTANLLIKTGTDNIIGTQAFDFTYGLFPAISAYIADMTDVFTLFKIDEFTTSETLTYNTSIGFKFSKTPYLTTIDTDLLYAKLNGGNTFNGTQIFNGDIIQNGAAYETHAQKLYSKQDLIIVREGAISGLATGGIAGYIAKNPKGDGFDIVLGVDNNGIVKVGKDGTTLQSLATRDDNIVNGNGVVYDAARKTFADAGYKWALKNGDILQDFNSKILTISDYLVSSTFISGITGTGFKYGLNAECDNLSIREGFTCNTFVNNKINISNGDMIVSDSAKIKLVTANNTAVLITEPVFKVGDILRCQQLAEDNSSLTVYYLTVTSLLHTIYEGKDAWWHFFTKTGTGTPKIGDLLVRWSGGLLHLNSSDAINGAYMDVVYDGLTKLRLGNLAGINDVSFGQLSGYGLYGDNVYLKGKMLLSAGSSIAFTDVTGTSDVASTIDVNYKTTHIDGTSITTGKIAGDRLQVGAWTINANSLYSGGTFGSGTAGIDIDGLAKRMIIHKDYYNFVNVFHSGINWGISGVRDNKEIFQLGSTNQIAGWNFDNSYLYKGIKTTTGFTANATDMTIGNGNILANKFRVESGVLWAIDGNFSGNITGSTITGGTIQTSAIDERIVLASDNSIRFYDAINVQRMTINGSVGGYESNQLGMYIDSILGGGSYYSGDGVAILNGKGQLMYALSTGFQSKAALVGVMNGSVDGINDFVAGVYGRATNIGTAKVFAGYFEGQTAMRIPIYEYPINNTTLTLNTYDYNINYVITATGAGYSRINLPTGCELGTRYVFYCHPLSTQELRIYPSGGDVLYIDNGTEANSRIDGGEKIEYLKVTNGWMVFWGGDR